MKKVSNPLTIIAVFAGLAEVAGSVALVSLGNEIQEIFVWFVMLFPGLLVLSFFGVLIFRPNVLYAPSDFSKDESFLEAIGGRDIFRNKINEIESIVNNLSSSIEGIESGREEQVKAELSEQIGEIKAGLLETKIKAELLSENLEDVINEGQEMRFSILLPEILKVRIFQIARLNNKSPAGMIRKILEEYFQQLDTHNNVIRQLDEIMDNLKNKIENR